MMEIEQKQHGGSELQGHKAGMYKKGRSNHGQLEDYAQKGKG